MATWFPETGAPVCAKFFPTPSISQIDRIIVAVAEEVVIASVEELRVFAHEPAQAGVINSRSILVNPCSVVFPAGEQKPVAVGAGCSDGPVRCVDRGGTEGVVAIPLDDGLLGLVRWVMLPS